MPARTNAFQKLIHLIQAHLAPKGFVVSESKPLPDLRDGTPREVDVVIEGKIGVHQVVISIEVTNGSRRADLEWVEQICAKHEHLSTNKLILVARSGFTRRAAKEARLRGVEALTFSEATALDWRMPVALKTMLLTYRRPYPSDLTFEVEMPTRPTTLQGRFLEFVLHFEGGVRKAPLGYAIRYALQEDREFLERMSADTSGPERWSQRMVMELRPGTRLYDTHGNSIIVRKVRFVARYTENKETVDLAFARLGDIGVVHGTAKTAFGDIVAVMTEPKGDTPMVSLDFVSGTEPDGGQLRIDWRDRPAGA